MMDIDFDELDRAVNSVLAKDQAKSIATNNAVAAAADSVQTLKTKDDSEGVSSVEPVKIRKTLKEAVAEAMVKPETSAPVQPVVNSQPQTKPLPVIPILKKYPPVGRPDTGRVMDVLHAPNDPRTTLVMPDRPLVQSSISSGIKSNYQPVAAAKPISPSVSTVMSSAPIPIAPPSPVVKAPVAAPQMIKDDEEDDIDKISNDITRAMSKKADESLSTPFLTNTKVDKRPLNAYMSDSVAPVKPITIPAPDQPSPTAVVPPVTINYSEKPALSTDKATFATMMKPVDLDAPLPPELQSELLSVEADTTIKSEAPVFAEPAPVPVYAAPVVPSSNVAPSASTVANAVTSIQPQYKEQPSSGEKNNGAIYDTKNYHKAIKTPSAIKTGGMWLAYFLILLVVGVVVGAAVFFFVLPRL